MVDEEAVLRVWQGKIAGSLRYMWGKLMLSTGQCVFRATVYFKAIQLAGGGNPLTGWSGIARVYRAKRAVPSHDKFRACSRNSSIVVAFDCRFIALLLSTLLFLTS